MKRCPKCDHGPLVWSYRSPVDPAKDLVFCPACLWKGTRGDAKEAP
jgi:hypothetical protein